MPFCFCKVTQIECPIKEYDEQFFKNLSIIMFITHEANNKIEQKCVSSHRSHKQNRNRRNYDNIPKCKNKPRAQHH